MFSSAALSRILIASACCSCVDSPGLLGQSMLPTVATHTPRNSRGAGGGWSCAAARTSGWRDGALQLMQLSIKQRMQTTTAAVQCDTRYSQIGDTCRGGL